MYYDSREVHFLAEENSLLRELIKLHMEEIKELKQAITELKTERDDLRQKISSKECNDEESDPDIDSFDDVYTYS